MLAVSGFFLCFLWNEAKPAERLNASCCTSHCDANFGWYLDCSRVGVSHLLSLHVALYQQFVEIRQQGVPALLLFIFLLFFPWAKSSVKWWERRFQNIWNKFWSSFHCGLPSDGKNCWCCYCAGTLRTKRDCKTCLPFSPPFLSQCSLGFLFASVHPFLHSFIHSFTSERDADRWPLELQQSACNRLLKYVLFSWRQPDFFLFEENVGWRVWKGPVYWLFEAVVFKVLFPHSATAWRQKFFSGMPLNLINRFSSSVFASLSAATRWVVSWELVG